MTIQRQSPGECEWKLSVYRDGERLANDDAAFQLTQFCSGWSIVEDITSASMEAEFVFSDAAGIQAIFTGSETLKLEVFTSLIDRTYFFRSRVLLVEHRMLVHKRLWSMDYQLII